MHMLPKIHMAELLPEYSENGPQKGLTPFLYTKNDTLMVPSSHSLSNSIHLQNYIQRIILLISYHLVWLCPRPISNSQLHALLHFHLCPIYLVVFKGSY